MKKNQDDLFIAKMVRGIIFIFDHGSITDRDDVETYLDFKQDKIQKRIYNGAENIVYLRGKFKCP